jgi:hypothetical protein
MVVFAQERSVPVVTAGILQCKPTQSAKYCILIGWSRATVLDYIVKYPRLSRNRFCPYGLSSWGNQGSSLSPYHKQGDMPYIRKHRLWPATSGRMSIRNGR